jgi:ArsR family transcriptional regulator
MEDIISLFKALSDRNRLRILSALFNADELCACQITELIKISGATISRHIGILISVKLVKSRKEGRWVFYSIDEDFINKNPALEWLALRLKSEPDLKTDKKQLKKIIALGPEEVCRRQRGEECCPKT